MPTNIYQFTSLTGKKSWKSEGDSEPEAYKQLVHRLFQRMSIKRPGVLLGPKAPLAETTSPDLAGGTGWAARLSKEEHDARIAEADALPDTSGYARAAADLGEVIAASLFESITGPDPIEPGGGSFGGGGASGDW